ncbi:MAG: hypothetical protein IJN90_06840 [Bacilli bacterium]|nr:hypothetical protein [Bacilli bacterium]
MKVLFKIILGIFTIFLLVFIFKTVSSFLPISISKREITNYVHDVYGEEYKFKERKELEDENGKVYKYIYSREDGFEFPIYTYRRHPVDHTLFGEMPWYENYVEDFFVPAFVEYYEEDLDSFIDSNFVVSDKKITNSFDFEYIYNLSLYLNDVTEIEKASNIIGNFNDIFNTRFGESNLSNVSYMTFGIDVYIKPNSLINLSNWKNNSKYRFYETSYSKLLYNDKKAKEIAPIIESNFINDVKTKSLTEYVISDELWNKYPAKYVNVISINNNSVFNYDYKFYYDEEVASYLMCDLYIGLDKDNSRKYRGTFSELVTLLGGTYSLDKERDYIDATWQIGNNIWNSRVNGREDKFTDISIYKNNILLLDKYSVSELGDSCYSVSKLEEILNVNILIDQRNVSATIMSK